jgi:lysozyme
MAKLNGIDISHWQAEPDWKELAKHIDFVYLKATEGNNYTDPTLVKRYKAAKAVGLKVGVYHFARFSSVEDALAEQKYFISVVGELDVDLPLVLDIENDAAKLSKATLTDACIAFLEAVKKATKKPVMVYTYDSFIGSELGSDLGEYPLWLADYGDHIMSPNSVWNKFAGMQVSQTGHVIGINGNVDIDWFNDDVLINPPKPAAPKFVTKSYIIRSGDTLSQLAARFKTTVTSLMKLNDIDDPHKIYAGVKLKYLAKA